MGEIVPNNRFYSYESKYIDEGTAQLIIPAKIELSIASKMKEVAVQAFTSIGCGGLARVDFFLEKSGSFILNEINTLPGFTNISMYPKLWEASGLSYSNLLKKLIKLAKLNN